MCNIEETTVRDELALSLTLTLTLSLTLGLDVTCFKTSIWDETLYRAWSMMVHTLVLTLTLTLNPTLTLTTVS